jgi:lipoate-protein ligase A
MSEEKAKWRFLGITTSDAATNMATDEAIALARSQDLVPNTVRLYMWKPPAVSLGYFLKAKDAVNLETCKKLGIDIVRRISGGGAVFHSENEVTYSVVVKQDDPVLPDDAIEVYKKLSAAIISVPEKLGLEVYFEPGHPGVCPNLVVAGRKISGNAQARKRGVILQHGTMLLDCDLEVMGEVLKIPYELIDAKVTTLKRELSNGGLDNNRTSSIETDNVQDILRKGFEDSLGIRLVDGELTKLEISQALILKQKYSSKEWTYMR